MKRLEYVCTNCGRPFGRKFVARRHLRDVHKGHGELTSVMGYMLGVIDGKFQWPRLPQNGRPPIDHIEDFRDTIKKMAQFSRDLREVSSFIGAGKELASQPNGSAHFVSGPKRKIFGYQVYVCDKCLAFKFRTLYFAVQSDGLLVQSAPLPCLNALPSISEIASDKISFLEKAKKDLPLFLERVIRDGFSKPILVAQLVDSNGQVIIRNLQDSSLSFTLSKSSQSVLPELDTDRADGTSWVARAMNNGWTELNKKELEEVTGLLHKATFGFVRIFYNSNLKVRGAMEEYFVYIAEGEGMIDLRG